MEYIVAIISITGIIIFVLAGINSIVNKQRLTLAEFISIITIMIDSFDKTYSKIKEPRKRQEKIFESIMVCLDLHKISRDLNLTPQGVETLVASIIKTHFDNKMNGNVNIGV